MVESDHFCVMRDDTSSHSDFTETTLNLPFFFGGGGGGGGGNKLRDTH
jgi:hypothetical protein